MYVCVNEIRTNVTLSANWQNDNGSWSQKFAQLKLFIQIQYGWRYLRNKLIVYAYVLNLFV